MDKSQRAFPPTNASDANMFQMLSRLGMFIALTGLAAFASPFRTSVQGFVFCGLTNHWASFALDEMDPDQAHMEQALVVVALSTAILIACMTLLVATL
jgi:hypothetical protein